MKIKDRKGNTKEQKRTTEDGSKDRIWGHITKKNKRKRTEAENEHTKEHLRTKGEIKR